jgi:class 3 adenylate cyclase
MHFGWAIEGAIGSPLKIDASYLSPHVNTAARLEAATKQFQTMFLLSDEFVKQLSPRNQRLCRRIDCVVRPRVRLVTYQPPAVFPPLATTLNLWRLFR